MPYIAPLIVPEDSLFKTFTMKHILLSLSFLFLIGVNMQDSFATPPADTEELILMVPTAEPNRNAPAIESALNNLGGVTVVGFCNSQKCFYINVDRHTQPDNRIIIEAITDLGHQVEVKQNGTIAEAQANCKDR
jgi:hypothetical protein